MVYCDFERGNFLLSCNETLLEARGLFKLLMKSCSSKREVLGWGSKPKSEVFVFPVVIYLLCSPEKSSNSVHVLKNGERVEGLSLAAGQHLTHHTKPFHKGTEL